MNKSTSLLTLSMLGVALSGCISHIGVTKVQPGTDPKGLRYYLPQPVIIGYPQPDGSVTYEEKMLPDLEKEYAIQSWSFMAKHKAKISRTSEMFLKKAELKQDTTVVASKLVESSGTVASDVVNRIGEENKARREEAKEKETKVAAAKNNVTVKEQAVKTAELQLQFAKADRDRLPADASAAEKADASRAVTEAERAVTKAELELDFARDAETAAKNADNPAADDPTKPKAKRGNAAGPVIYRIVENPRTGGVNLEPMTFKVMAFATKRARAQRRFETVTLPEKPAEEKKKSDADAPTASIHLTQTQTQTQVAMSAGVQVIVAESKVIRASTGEDASDQFKLAARADGGALDVERKPLTPAGEYRITVVGKTASGAKHQVTRRVVVDAQ